jgi:hypothetical protein
MKLTGGTAFPTNDNPTFSASEGMTLRDYFAAKALPAILEQMDVCDGRQLTNSAWIAYQMADAMLQARNN